MNTIKVGDIGEQAALDYLHTAGYDILERKLRAARLAPCQSRSRMLLRSKSATPARIVRRNRPEGSPVSNGSVIDLIFIPYCSKV